MLYLKRFSFYALNAFRKRIRLPVKPQCFGAYDRNNKKRIKAELIIKRNKFQFL